MHESEIFTFILQVKLWIWLLVFFDFRLLLVVLWCSMLGAAWLLLVSFVMLCSWFFVAWVFLQLLLSFWAGCYFVVFILFSFSFIVPLLLNLSELSILPNYQKKKKLWIINCKSLVRVTWTMTSWEFQLTIFLLFHALFCLYHCLTLKFSY